MRLSGLCLVIERRITCLRSLQVPVTPTEVRFHLNAGRPDLGVTGLRLWGALSWLSGLIGLRRKPRASYSRNTRATARFTRRVM